MLTIALSKGRILDDTLPLLAAAFALWYRRNAETRVPLTSPGKLEKDVSVPASGGG